MAAVVGLALALSAAVGVGKAAVGGSAAPQASPLAKACGSKIVVQTDWYPEPEQGYLYELAGTNGTLDASHGHYDGTIKGTGVQLEIRAGGPYIAYDDPIAKIHEDSSITLGTASSDDVLQNSGSLPVVSIVAPNEFSPLILMWNPQKFPNVHHFADIKATGAPVLVFPGGTYVNFLEGRGWISSSQVDTSYDGSPARFVSADGGIFQQGYITSEPYKYEHQISQYNKPVSYLLVRNAGYAPYSETLVARPQDVTAKAACFKLLVPLVQQAVVDYAKNPTPVNRKLEQIVTTMNTSWQLSPSADAYNTATQLKYKIISNGSDCTLGNFSMNRLQVLINTVLPIYKAQGLSTANPNVKPSDVATNRFVKPAIGLPAKGCPKR
ncbi:MAG TPA: hypothetical protein VFM96_11780 [Gaiellaceae bacterium]|nr:hypothetical protein [Gaiellaceae bacterium]